MAGVAVANMRYTNDVKLLMIQETASTNAYNTIQTSYAGVQVMSFETAEFTPNVTELNIADKTNVTHPITLETRRTMDYSTLTITFNLAYHHEMFFEAQINQAITTGAQKYNTGTRKPLSYQSPNAKLSRRS